MSKEHKNRYTKEEIDKIMEEYENDKRDKCIHIVRQLGNDINTLVCNECNKTWCCTKCKSNIKQNDLYSSSFMKINKLVNIYQCSECKNNIKETNIILSRL